MTIFHVIKISIEKFIDVKDEVAGLIKDHYKEISWHSDSEFQINIEAYERIERANGLFAFVARRDNAIVGYNMYYVHRHNHVNALQALQDVIYVIPSLRKSREMVGPRLIQYAEDFFRSIGVKYIINSVNTKNDNGYSKLLTRFGYEPVDNLYGKRL